MKINDVLPTCFGLKGRRCPVRVVDMIWLETTLFRGQMGN